MFLQEPGGGKCLKINQYYWSAIIHHFFWTVDFCILTATVVHLLLLRMGKKSLQSVFSPLDVTKSITMRYMTSSLILF